MKKLVVFLMFLGLFIGSISLAQAAVWYDVTFTGADIWTYSADNASASPASQNAPRRYSTFNSALGPDGTGPRVVQDTTYGVNGGTASTVANLGFGGWAPTSGFAFDEINLWGKDDAAAVAWGEKYVAVPDNANNGITSWKVISAPTGWTDGIVSGNQSYNAGPGAFPVWRSSGTTDMLGIANKNDSAFAFEFQVLIDNPATAFEPDGTLRVFFGGYRDDLQGAGPGNYEVSGVMTLKATQVPEPTTMLLLGLGLVGLAGIRRKFRS